MARDAQLGGDRVQTEYYLQYADHYYRILGESRARFEEQRRQSGDADDDGDDDGQMEAGYDQGSQDDGGDDDRPQRNERFDRGRPQPQQRERFEQADRPERSERPERNERPERAERPERSERPQRNERRPRYARDANGDAAPDRASSDSRDEAPLSGNLESIAFDALPPAIGRVDSVDQADSEVEAPAPKRRTRKPRAAAGDTDAAPAA